jgi:hypothetical protein
MENSSSAWKIDISLKVILSICISPPFKGLD